jgi:hypothetical protein
VLGFITGIEPGMIATDSSILAHGYYISRLYSNSYIILLKLINLARILINWSKYQLKLRVITRTHKIRDQVNCVT